MERFFRKTTFFSILTALLFAGSTFHYARLAEDYGRLLDQSSQQAMSELVSELSQMDAALAKLRYASTPLSFQTISAKLWQSAENAKSAMSALALEAGALDKTQKFVGQTGDFAYYLLFSSAGGSGMSAEHRAALDSLFAASENVTREIGSLKQQLDVGQLSYRSLSEDSDRSSGGDLSGGLSGIEQEFPEYATLIYDGPFSEHLNRQKPLLLEGMDTVSAEQSTRNAAAFLDIPVTDLQLLYETENDKIPSRCLATEDGRTVEVSNRGGMVFTYRDPRPIGVPRLEAEAAIKKAKTWLDAHGFTGMKESYYTLFDNTITVNFAYTQNGITVYSDLIKVSVALDDGSIVGMEARGYVMSHRSRTLPRPAISEAEGRAVVSSRLTIQSENLALIPTSGQNEVLCREYVCTDEEGRHIIVYVNARTGQEENIYLLVEDENGILTI